jgi:NAD(P)-dependent dehydrogenase (short-subunit alcohol dehydrogenase family)
MPTDELQGRVFLITGANTGIGRVTARELAARGGRVYLTARTEARAAAVLDEIRAAGGDVHFLPLELGSLKSVRACAEAFLATGDPLHVLILNAGLGGHIGRTEDGFELQFGVNHLGHFLLTKLLLEHLKASTPARVVTVSSKAHRRPSRVDYDVERKTRGISGFPAYASSKLANVLFSNELARRLEGTGVTTYALHPGVIKTDAWRRIPRPLRGFITRNMITVEEGAKTTLYCATAPELDGVSGRYYARCAESEPASAALDEEAARELWEKSEEWVAPFV